MDRVRRDAGPRSSGRPRRIEAPDPGFGLVTITPRHSNASVERLAHVGEEVAPRLVEAGHEDQAVHAVGEREDVGRSDEWGAMDDEDDRSLLDGLQDLVEAW